MGARIDGESYRQLDALCRLGAIGAATDGQLLEHFLGDDGNAAEAAFETLVRRHGPLVLERCRSILRDSHDADDAFQATFLVLARRADTIRDRDRLDPWLGRVSRRIALRSRDRLARGRSRERRGIEPIADLAVAEARETASIVRDEVDRLPESDRLPLILTYWQGKSYVEVTAMLGWPIGTVRSRLSRARERLRGRLSRLGLAPLVRGPDETGTGSESAKVPVPVLSGPLTLTLADRSEAAPTAVLIARTVRLATRGSTAGSSAAGIGTVPTALAAIVDGELAMIALSPWKWAAALLLAGGSIALGAASLRRPNADPLPEGPPMARPPAATSPTPLPDQGEAESLLTNGGLEIGDGEAPEGWSERADIPGVRLLWDREAAHEGKASLRLEKTAQRYFPIAQWFQEFDAPDDARRLKVSAWIKAEHASKAILDAQFLGDDGEWTHAWVSYIGAREADDPPVTHDWTRYEGVVAIPPGTRRIIVAAQIYGPGTAWFDDLAASPTDDPETDPLDP